MGSGRRTEDGGLRQIRRVIDGRELIFDEEGFFTDFADWSRKACLLLAAESGLPRLEERHWQVIEFLRGFYAHHGRAPLNNELRRGAGIALLEVEELFPEGIRQGARRLAGLPNPKTCE